MAGAGIIRLDLCEDVFPRVKNTAELRSRMRTEITDDIVATDSDLKVFRTYFKDFIAELTNETASFGEIRDTQDGGLTYTLTDRQKDGGLAKLKPLLELLSAEYLLWRWYDDLGIGDLMELSRVRYIDLLNKWKHNNTNEAFVTPTYRPYF